MHRLIYFACISRLCRHIPHGKKMGTRCMMPILHRGHAPTRPAHSPQQAMWPHGANATARAPAMQIAQARLFCRSVAAA